MISTLSRDGFLTGDGGEVDLWPVGGTRRQWSPQDDTPRGKEAPWRRRNFHRFTQICHFEYFRISIGILFLRRRLFSAFRLRPFF